jgi:hypothetical protein
LVVGFGKTRALASADAMKAIPAPTRRVIYEPNSSWASPAIQCVGSGVWSEDHECNGGDVQYVIPLKKIEQ